MYEVKYMSATTAMYGSLEEARMFLSYAPRKWRYIRKKGIERYELYLPKLESGKESRLIVTIRRM